MVSGAPYLPGHRRWCGAVLVDGSVVEDPAGEWVSMCVAACGCGWVDTERAMPTPAGADFTVDRWYFFHFLPAWREHTARLTEQRRRARRTATVEHLVDRGLYDAAADLL